jgi:TolB-like protein/DNA-binding winged helix-turn-helix (wHTH) protein/Tfp pilus assembly protein PilF
MEQNGDRRTRVRFGTFELDLATGEIRRAGVPIHLPAQPTAVLQLLVRRTGALVPREEIGRLLWHDRWEEFDPGINTCIRQIRSALGDNAASPTFVETVPRRGYRFIAPVEWLPAEAAWPGASGRPAVTPLHKAAPRRRRWPVATAATLALASFAAVAAVLRAGETGAEPRLMLAVLPFETMDADSSLDYLGAGLTEELITLLASVEPVQVGVIARTSAVAAARTGGTVAAIGETLDVDYIVQGAIRSGTDRVRITAQLIRVDDQTHVWAETFDRALLDVLDVQRDVARRVAGALAPTLAGPPTDGTTEPASPARLKTLEARWLLDQSGAEAVERSLALLDSAIAIDPEYAPAWSTRARALTTASTGSPEDIEHIRRAAARAVALDDAQVDAHLILARLLYQRDWNAHAAEFEFRRALALAPGQATVHHTHSMFLAATGRLEEATAAIETAMRLDPVSTLVIGDAAFVHYLAGDFERAASYAQRVLALDQNNIGALSLLVNLASVRDRPDDAARYGFRLGRVVRGPDSTIDPATYPDITAAENAFWRSWIGWWRANTTGPLTAYQAAIGFAHLGRPDSAIAELEAGYAAHAGGLAFVGVEPAFAPLHGRPAFDAVVSGIGLIRPASSGKPASD